MNLPRQDEISLHAMRMQCRVTTEESRERIPAGYTQIQPICSPAGFGIRLDGASAYGASVITPYYDSLLLESDGWGREFPQACRRMDRCLREFRIRGVKTKHPVLFRKPL